MNNLKNIILAFFLVALGCKNNHERKQETQEIKLETESVQVQGHRGDRGSFPENSIPAFISAVEKGVDVLELDVVISKDRKVVVSHEPFMSSLFVTTPTGDSIQKANERSYNMYQMTYDSIRQYDAGSRGNRLFPEQEKIRTFKPLLSEVIDSVKNFIAAKGLQPVKFNIEIKSVEAEYGIYQPEPEEFVDLVMKIIREKEMENIVSLQSFDPEILKVVNKNFPEIEIAYLVYREGIEKNLSLLDFKPEIYSPNYTLVKNEQFVDSIRMQKMDLIPWTVNEARDIQKMMDLKVDGIITDYPERVLEMRKNTF